MKIQYYSALLFSILGQKMSLIKSIKKRINRKKIKNQRNYVQNKYINKIFPELIVRHGPFSGMEYPLASSVGSSLFPKLLGSYESELSDIMGEICNKDYTSIVDIGCAEGYYATGLALKIKSAHVYAFDVNEKARNLCSQMFENNMIDSQRYTIDSFCSKETLVNLDFGKKGLVFCDCEGYEKELFDESNLDVLKNHDLLIETHDCFDINISTYLYDLFKDTHTITVIESIDDIQKAKKYNYDEINDCSLEEKYILLREGRRTIMEWFYLESKANV